MLLVYNFFIFLVFSIFGAYRCIPAFIQLYKWHGIRGTLCATYYYQSKPEGLWVLLFVLSKVPELLDTFFIIARKRKLIFLHWYHHFTVLMYSFYLYRDRLAGGAYYGGMNYSVHAVMYSYYFEISKNWTHTFWKGIPILHYFCYFLSACRIKVPRPIAMLVTILQTSQMFVGVAVTVFLWTQLNNDECPIHIYNVLAATAMYSTYLYLFSEFFYNAYFKKSKLKSQ